MDKAVFKYLKKRGVNVTVPFAEDVPFSERAPKFFEWFHKSVLNLDTDEYRREFWHEVYKSGHIIGPVPYTLENYLKRRGVAYRQDAVNIFVYAILMGGSFAVWIIQRQIEKHIRRLRRPTYYETEMVRRKKLAKERRKINKRSTANPCPTVDEIKNAFQHAKDSPAAMIRFGSVLEDLECYVDNSAIFDGNGNIVGRKGGIRQFLREEIPELAQRYKTVMKYKTLAKRFRQVLGVQDPVPASLLIEKEGENKRYESCQKVKMKRDGEYGGGKREFVSERSIERGLGEDCAESTEKITGAIDVIVNTNSFGKVENNEDVKVMARKLLSECENTYMSVSAMITLMISPDYTPRLAPEAQRLRTLLAEAKYVPKGALAMLGA